MAGLFTADIENRGLVLDPRTKLFVIITLVIFALSGTGSDIAAVRYGTAAVSILPAVLLLTAKQYGKAAVFGILFAAVKAAELLLLPRTTGAALSILGICCMVFVRLMPGSSWAHICSHPRRSANSSPPCTGCISRSRSRSRFR